MRARARIVIGMNRAFGKLGFQVSRYRTPEARIGLETPMPTGPQIVDMGEFERLWHEYKLHPLDALSSSIWHQGTEFSATLKDINLTRFRADNAYVWQTRGASVADFALSALWAERSDSFGLLTRTQESGAFGVECLRIDDRLWSRDLIDSILEITFLMENLPSGTLDAMNVVDIGAGYGRLLSRLADVTGSPQLFGVDGVALSTSICRAYIRYMRVDSRVSVLSLREADELDAEIDLAINIHSFSEMSLEAVCWWLDWLVDRGTRYLFLVPNRPGPSLNDGTDLASAISQRGFVLKAERLKYEDPLIGEHALYQAHYYLFAR
jgi:putative sugar O-methyltransferase